MGSLDLVGAWQTFWGKVGAAYTGTAIETAVTIIGIGLIAFSVAKFFWDKRRGGGGAKGMGSIGWYLLLGSLAISPNVLIPAVLGALQWVINLFLNLLGNVTG
jgi:hypothetical protein